MSPHDFSPPPDGFDIYIRVNNDYVLSARPTEDCRPGEIGLTDAQRTWAGISLGPHDLVNVEAYHVFAHGGHSYLGNIEVEVGFATRKTTETLYDQEELGALLKKVCMSVVTVRDIVVLTTM